MRVIKRMNTYLDLLPMISYSSQYNIYLKILRSFVLVKEKVAMLFS